jgi:glutathione S-transferase
MMQLFSFATSPYARKVRIVLDYKGVPYESCERCYSLDRKDDLRNASIRAEVPVLVLDNGRTIYDSTIICEFLEQGYPDPAIFPKDAFERARMRMIEDLCDRTFDAIGFGYFFGVLRKDAPESTAMREAAKTECRALMEKLENELGGRPLLLRRHPVARRLCRHYAYAAHARDAARSSWARKYQCLDGSDAQAARSERGSRTGGQGLAGLT